MLNNIHIHTHVQKHEHVVFYYGASIHFLIGTLYMYNGEVLSTAAVCITIGSIIIN